MTKCIGNIYCSKSDNVGDRYSTPMLYFDFPGCRIERTTWSRAPRQNLSALILGGGIVSANLLKQATWVLPKATRLIFWGGSTSLSRELKAEVFRIPQHWLDLVGTRERYDDIPWVPCASCMHELFDEAKDYPVKYDAVYYENARTSPLGDVSGPRMGNGLNELECVLRFLASGRTVVTSSYHGMYWATLLGRRVVAVPFSSKFYRFPFPVTYATRQTLTAVLRRELPAPMDALTKCRAANRDFYRNVCNLLEIQR